MRSRLSEGVTLRRQSEGNIVCRCGPRSHQAGVNALDVINGGICPSGGDAILNQVIYHGRVSQCRGITQ